MVRKRGRSALASVYGFIVIYLLAIASLQAISLAVSGSEEADQAAQRAQQVDQERSVERLQVSLSGGNLTITNDGLIPSMVSSILVQNSTFSMDVEFQDSLGVGASVTESLGAAISSPSAAAVVTTLGNVFEASRAPAPAGGFNVIGGTVGGPNLDAQIYQNPSDPSRLFLAVGSSVYALSTSTGKETWSFNASQGEITDVLPLSSGDVYVSDGYFGNQFTSNLFHLNSAGASLAAYSMRLFKLWTTLGSDIPPWPFGSQPVDKGADSLYAYYDGWFFSSAGASTTILAGDSYFLAAEDSDQFYALELSPNPGGYGCSGTHGNFATVYAYSADSRGVIQEWSTMAFLNSCDYYLNAVVSASSNSGTLALLLSQVYCRPRPTTVVPTRARTPTWWSYQRAGPS